MQELEAPKNPCKDKHFQFYDAMVQHCKEKEDIHHKFVHQFFTNLLNFNTQIEYVSTDNALENYNKKITVIMIKK